mmetsp:Transcript_24905/g.65682  ORF Transcript_24905/g.65682 Transcript_24905/m.65682 type:complete len:281 (+) Transcript_24905:141-983(+)
MCWGKCIIPHSLGPRRTAQRPAQRARAIPHDTQRAEAPPASPRSAEITRRAREPCPTCQRAEQNASRRDGKYMCCEQIAQKQLISSSSCTTVAGLASRPTTASSPAFSRCAPAASAAAAVSPMRPSSSRARVRCHSRSSRSRCSLWSSSRASSPYSAAAPPTCRAVASSSRARCTCSCAALGTAIGATDATGADASSGIISTSSSSSSSPTSQPLSPASVLCGTMGSWKTASTLTGESSGSDEKEALRLSVTSWSRASFQSDASALDGEGGPSISCGISL